MRILVTEPLDSASFASFGEVLSFNAASARTVNDGWAQRSDLALGLDDGGSGVVPRLAFFRASHQSLPASIPFVEQHPHSSQVFLPLASRGFLVVVAPSLADGSPGVAEARAFLGAPGQGVNYRRGVWHGPITAIESDTDFLMLIWERDMPDDCIVQRLSPPLTVGPAATAAVTREEAIHGA
jgi:ureidoglycolate lyase